MVLMKLIARFLIALLCLPMVTPAGAASTTYRTSFVHWRAAEGGFTAWQLTGTNRGTDGVLRLDPQTASSGTDPAGAYFGQNFYNGGNFQVGEALSPPITISFGFQEAIASWNAETPDGTWIEVLVRVQIGARWTKWYNLGVWADDYATIRRHSASEGGDTDATIAVDTLVLRSKKLPTTAQLKLRLFNTTAGAIPSVRTVALATSTTPSKPRTLTPGDRSRWNRVLGVPECSQMVYPDGGEVWCSPTSTSMVLAYWQQASGPCEPRVRAAVDGTYDWRYNGHGNWPFNTAYAAAQEGDGTQKLEGAVARFTSLAQAEAWIAAGVPVVISYAWGQNQLSGAPLTASAGHLAVLVGFDATGNPLVNDPAASSDGAVQRTYMRAQLESLWLQHSGGTVYLIYPVGLALPPL